MINLGRANILEMAKRIVKDIDIQEFVEEKLRVNLEWKEKNRKTES
ncbi:MAG: hypothetical protein IJ794_05470 [Lachnospiraceae bacterium]|nr:hypothetical protein [Lachnospiraceae bacterium]